jgi:hypothetical protein
MLCRPGVKDVTVYFRQDFHTRHLPIPNSYGSTMPLPSTKSIPLHNAATCIAQSLHRSVVTPARELLLHGLAQHWAFNIAVRRRFRCELLVKVRCIPLIEH